MARATSKPKKEISMEEALWKSADKLRGSVEPAEYKHVVLSLFFLKFASDKFEAQRKAISEKYGEKFVDNVAFYTKDNVFFLPEISRWSFIMANAKQDDIALKIDTALYTIAALRRECSATAHTPAVRQGLLSCIGIPAEWCAASTTPACPALRARLRPEYPLKYCTVVLSFQHLQINSLEYNTLYKNDYSRKRCK